MKSFFTSILLFSSFYLYAQPSISSDAIIYLGEQEPTSFFALNAQNWESGLSGENQTWNFGDLSAGEECDYLALDPKESMYFDSFPNSDIYFKCESVDSDGNLTEQYTFYEIDNNTLSLSGNVSVSISNPAFDSIFTVFVNPLEWGIFTYNFGDITTDDFAARVTSYIGDQTIIVVQEGTSTQEVDSYGTLTTPAGTFENTLRIKRIELAENSIPGIPFTTPQESYRYTWYGENEKGVLLNLDSIVIKDFTGAIVNTTYNGNYRIAGPSTTSSTNSLEQKVLLYPNPTSGDVNIEMADIKSHNLSIYGPTGEVVPYTISSQTKDSYRIRLYNAKSSKLYIIKLTDSSGNVKYSKILVSQN